MGDYNLKQVIVIRRDLKMRQGKACAQAAHASMLELIDVFMFHGCTSDGIYISNRQADWFRQGMPKIVLRVDSAEDLDAIVQAARAAKLPVYEVTDAGCTEFHGVPTKTCCAIGPADSAAIDAITGHLKLL